MFEGIFQPMHLLLLLAIALLIFGPKNLPDLGKSLGESIHEFKKAVSSDDKRFSAAADIPEDTHEPKQIP